jgi:hypothetical protein
MRSGRYLQDSPLLPYIAVNIKPYRHILRALTLVNYENFLIMQRNCVGLSIEQDVKDKNPRTAKAIRGFRSGCLFCVGQKLV